jgi:hypothetical protein
MKSARGTRGRISREAWAAPTDFAEVCRRAGGRRRYNAVRRFNAALRRVKVGEMLLRHGTRHGVQAMIARALGVSEATVSRDRAALARAGRSYPGLGETCCPLCLRPGWRGAKAWWDRTLGGPA